MRPELSGGALENAGSGNLINRKVETERGTLHGPLRIAGITLSDVDARVSARIPELLVGAYTMQKSALMIDQRSQTVSVCPR